MGSSERTVGPGSRTRPNRKKKSPLPIVFALLSSGLAAESICAALTSPRFEVKTVVVQGNRELTSDEIVKAAAIPLGGNLFRIRTRVGSERIARLPRVRHCTVHRRFPDRIVIEVEERRPVALLAAGETYYLVDETGTPYAPLDRNGLRLPVLRLDPAPTITPGRPLETDAFRTGMKALLVIDRALSWRASLQVDPHLDLCLNRGEFSVRLGQPNDLEKKLQTLKGLIASDPRLPERARYLDLSAPDYPAVMPGEPSFASLGPGASPQPSLPSGR